ncbi:MAG: replication restart helicase PriA [Brevinema sp.]
MKEWILAEVVLNVPLYSTFYYIIPEQFQDIDLALKRVKVHFGRRGDTAFVLRTILESQAPIDLRNLNSIKEIEEILDETPILTNDLVSLGKSVAEYYHAPIGEVFFMILPPSQNTVQKSFTNPYRSHTKNFTPNDEQLNIFQNIKNMVGTHSTCLLQGITGSGKTEVYKLLARECLNHGKDGIILVPEIALTDQTLRRFSEEFGNQIALFHSKLSPAERSSEWFRVLKGEASLVIGPRSAIFAPVKNLGLIIIDEEHDPSYKALDSPRYHARGVAFLRSKQQQALLVLGSATPSIESRYAAEKGIIHRVVLENRFNNTPLPQVEIIDLKQEKTGNNFLSEQLFTKLITNLSQKKQSLIFLNRRGYSPSLLCKDCGFFFRCPHCDIGMTWHKQESKVKCRYCDFEDSAPHSCPECGGFNIKDVGHGTEKLEDTLQNLLPSARILRLDLDTAKKKQGSNKILKAMQNHEADILVGTQMIAKGHDIANITLVGALFPEIILSLPDFRAAERTFSLLSQAIGRAGRRDIQGEAIIQTYLAEHFAVQLATTQDYEEFYRQEIQIRKDFNYPPFIRIGRIVFRSPNEELIIQLNYSIKKELKKHESKISQQQLEILGPSPCPIERINNHYRYHVLIKSQTHTALLKIVKYLYKVYKRFPHYQKIKIEIDIDPTQIL